jgi:uncharacterized membrane protein
VRCLLALLVSERAFHFVVVNIFFLLALLVSERAFRAEKREEGICEHNVLRQYLYFCTSKASILSTKRALRAEKGEDAICEFTCFTGTKVALLVQKYK